MVLLDISGYGMLFNAICVAIHCSLCQQHPSLQPLSSLWSQLRSSILWSFPSSCLPPDLVRIIPLLFFANNDWCFGGGVVFCFVLSLTSCLIQSHYLPIQAGILVILLFPPQNSYSSHSTTGLGLSILPFEFEIFEFLNFVSSFPPP